MAADAVTLIMNDHRVMESLFEMLKDPKSDRPALLSEVTARLSAHAWAEEERVYTALIKAEPSEEGQVFHGVEEHHEAAELLHKLQVTDPASPEFDTVLEEFVNAVQHHVEEEESEILPELADALDDSRLEQIGAAFEERRLEILRAHGITDQAVGSGGAVAQLARSASAGRADVAEMSREELYEKAKQADIAGRSQMNKDELAKAVQQEA
ncbi:MAG TPA: hemerythrin domain-containing protein [Pilimelia sp.]|nr:hemerythrin domain-containing protein [Pilimelia sp.]